MVGALGLAGGVAALALAAAQAGRAPRCCALLVAMIAVDYTFVVRVLPDFERYKPVPAFSARSWRRGCSRRTSSRNYQVALPSMVYYLARHVDQYFDEEPFVQAILSPRRRLRGACRPTTTRTLRRTIGGRTCILYRRPTFDVKLKHVLAREPLPELLLITNQCQVDR